MYDEIEEGITGEEFRTNIQERYADLMFKYQNDLWESKDFRIPTFEEQLDFVLEFYNLNS